MELTRTWLRQKSKGFDRMTGNRAWKAGVGHAYCDRTDTVPISRNPVVCTGVIPRPSLDLSGRERPPDAAARGSSLTNDLCARVREGVTQVTKRQVAILSNIKIARQPFEVQRYITRQARCSHFCCSPIALVPLQTPVYPSEHASRSP